jgi:hypothetical protein
MIYSTPKYQAHAAAPIYKMKPKRVEKASKNHGKLSAKLCRFLLKRCTLVNHPETFSRTQIKRRLHSCISVLHREIDGVFITSHADVFGILSSPHSPRSGSCSATSLTPACRSYSVKCFIFPQHAPFLEHQ